MKIKKSDLIGSWNEVEEVIADLDQLSDEEIIENKSVIKSRLVRALNTLGSYFTEEEANEFLSR